MNASEIRLHGMPGEIRDDRCHWCEASLDGSGRHPRAEPRYAIDAGKRVLVEVELWACIDCASLAEPLSDADRAYLQQRLDEMTPPVVGQCEACEQEGEIFPHFDQDEGDEYLLCERCFYEAP